MNNYKIIENRPELTSSQVVAGMNFTAVKAGALALSAGALGGKAIGAGLITKGFIAVLAVTGGLAVYKNYTTYKDDPSAYVQARENSNVIQRDKSKGPLLIMETIPPKNNPGSELTVNGTCQGSDQKNNNESNFKGPYIPLVNIDSLNALEEAAVTPTKTLSLAPGMTCRKAGEEPILAFAKKLADEFKASSNAECTIWQPGSFCIAPNEKTRDINMKCEGEGCEFDYINCTGLDGKGYSAVRLRVNVSNSTKFRVTSNFKNISLVKSTETQSSSFNPVAVSFNSYYDSTRSTKWNFLSEKTKADRWTIMFTDYIDIYLVFKEEVTAGDKIIIEDFVMAKVTE
jgi:hypothetical protein